MSAARDAIIAAVHERRLEIAELVATLVQCDSTNPYWPGGDPHGEQRCQQSLADRLANRGFNVDLWEPDPDQLRPYAGQPGHQPGRTFHGRPNLAAHLPGSGNGRSVLLAGHVDVVGAGDTTQWTHPAFGGVCTDGMVHGRGTVDMKGGLAAMLVAVEVLQDLGLQPGGDVRWASVVDEETGGMGTLALLDRGYRADAAIMAEPTGGRIATGCRGILWGAIDVAGRPGHIELPQAPWSDGGAVDAIAHARRILDHLDEVNARWAHDPSKQHPLLEIPNRICVAQVDAGEHPTSWAGHARIVFDAQYLPHEQDTGGLGGTVAAEIEREIAAIANGDAWLATHPPTVEWILDADCAEVGLDHPWIQQLTTAATSVGAVADPMLIGAHTDSSLLVKWGIPTAVVGPGASYRAHQIDEQVSIDDLVAATELYAVALARWGHWTASGNT